MGRQIIKQPNGLFCIFSSVVDDVILYDATVEELIEWEIAEATEKIRERIKATVRDLENEIAKPYPSISYEEMCEIIQLHHGKDYSQGITE